MLNHVGWEVVGRPHAGNLLAVNEALCLILKSLRRKRLEYRNFILREGGIDGHGKYLDDLMSRFVGDSLHVERAKGASQSKHEDPVVISAR